MHPFSQTFEIQMNTKKYKTNLSKIFFFLLAVVLLTSCTTSKKSAKSIPYFTDFSDSAKEKIVSSANVPQLKIQPDDILNITLQTTDPLASTIQSPTVTTTSALYPINGGQTIGTPGSTVTTGFLVDKDGYVVLPLFGKLKLSGLTTDEATKLIFDKSANYYKSSVVNVNVRFANLKVGILGEVTKPGYYILPTEKNTILDALLYAGDLTIYGKRDNLILIRDSANVKTMYRFSLNNSGVMTEPYFYLKQNDIIYVEPNKQKIDSNLNATVYTKIGLLLSALTVVILAVTQLK